MISKRLTNNPKIKKSVDKAIRELELYGRTLVTDPQVTKSLSRQLRCFKSKHDIWTAKDWKHGNIFVIKPNKKLVKYEKNNYSMIKIVNEK